MGPTDALSFAGAVLVAAGAAATVAISHFARERADDGGGRGRRSPTRRWPTNSSPTSRSTRATWRRHNWRRVNCGRLGDHLHDTHAVAFGAVDSALAFAYAGDGVAALERLDGDTPHDLAPTDAAWLAYARG